MKNRIFGCVLGAVMSVTLGAWADDAVVTSEEADAKEVSGNLAGGSAITPSSTETVESSDFIDDLKKKAESGDVEAQLNLGYIYLYGINGATIDYKQALSYYEAAAAQDSAIAYNNLGSLYFLGIGTDVDYPKAIELFNKASELGSHDAAVNLAIIYLSNESENKTHENYAKVLELLEQGAKDNYIAKFLLGYAYATGFLVKQNYTKAFGLIKAAADNQYDEAQYVLADLYIHGLGTAKNYSRAVEYLQKASDQGNIGAMTLLADILAEGKKYQKDIKTAHMLYNVASVLGAKDAGSKRDLLEKNLAIEDLLAIQASAENYTPAPSEQTTFIRRTYGSSLKGYIDANLNEPEAKNFLEQSKEQKK